MIQLVDTHAHAYMDKFSEDEELMIQRALDCGLEKIFLPNIDLDTIEPMWQLSQRYPRLCFPMMGLHPCSVAPNYMKVLQTMKSHLDQGGYAGIGETGIDLFWDTSSKEIQMKSFSIQIDWAIEYQLPLIIHSRGALDITIEMVHQKKCDELRGVFHCFDGSLAQAEWIMDLGFYMGIGGVVTYKKSHLPELIQQIGLDRIVLETDAPFLSPMPKRGKRNESSYLIHTASFVAEKMKMSLPELAETTTNNARELFMGKNSN